MSFYEQITGKVDVADDEVESSPRPPRIQASSPDLHSCFDSSSSSPSSDDHGNTTTDTLFSPPSSPPALFSPDKGKATSPNQLLSSPPLPSQSPLPRPSSATLLARIAAYEGREAKVKAARREEPVYNTVDTWKQATLGERRQAPARDYSHISLGSPGPNRGRSMIASNARDESEVDANSDGMLGRLQTWEVSGIAKRTSLASPDQLAPTEVEEAKTRAWWAGVQEAGDRSLRDDENDPNYPRCNISSSCFRSFMPSKTERTDLIDGMNLIPVIPVPGREEVIQISNSLPTHKASGIFFDRIVQMNEERLQQALSYKDAFDIEPNSSPIVDKPKIVNNSLRESLKEKLPMPGVFATEVNPPTQTTKKFSPVFTTATYRSKYHTHSHIVGAIAVPDGSLKDVALGARATQYNNNKKTVEVALNLMKKPAKRVASVANAVGHKPIELEFQEKVLESWELERDIQRLEATLRNISNAKIMVKKAPLLSSCSIRRKIRRSVIPLSRSQIQATGDSLDADGNVWDEEAEGNPPADAESFDKIVDALPPLGNQLHRSDNDSLGTPNVSVDPLTSSGERSPNDEPEQSPAVGSPEIRSSSVHSHSCATVRSGVTTPHAEPPNQHAVDAQALMNGLGPVSRSIRRSNTVSTHASSGNQSGAQNTPWPGDGLYAKYQTFIQQ